MGALLELCVAAAVAGSLLAALLYGALFAFTAVSTAIRRRRPDPITVSLDRFLTDMLGEDPTGTPGQGRAPVAGERER